MTTDPSQQPHDPPPGDAESGAKAATSAPEETDAPPAVSAPAVEAIPAMPDHPPTPASRWSRLSKGAALAIGAGLGAAAVGLCWAGVGLLGGGGAAEFDTGGTLTLSDVGVGDDGMCTGTGGYSDIHFGTQVTVTDTEGTLVAMGELGLGRRTSLGCEFPFTVTGVTPGSKFYTVEVAHRGGLTQTEEELRSADLSFSLGD